MELSPSAQTILEKARALGGGAQGVALTDDQCCGLIGVAARDLNLEDRFEHIPDLPGFYEAEPPDTLVFSGDLAKLYRQLVAADDAASTYFGALASLQKGRLKFRRILATQAVPTIDQVGPRGLLEYGALPVEELVVLLFWRKWMYDIDNRAAQETGYLFEPIIAGAIGGTPAPASKSPVKRRNDPSKGRQVDCVRERYAYEFKLRITIAASGQGRWSEELDFPRDCQASNYVPRLIVFDPTENQKLTELINAFEEVGGQAFVGEQAWEHLESLAGSTMAIFLEKYVRGPLAELLAATPDDLSDVSLAMEAGEVRFTVGEHVYCVGRDPIPSLDSDAPEAMPEDADEQLPG